jgi:hypothetical protein
MTRDTARYRTYFPQAEFDRPRTRLRIRACLQLGEALRENGSESNAEHLAWSGRSGIPKSAIV